MIAKLITKLFTTLMTIIFTIIQLICLPLNLLFENVFPDFTTWINKVTSVLTTALSGLSWAFSIIPPAVRSLIGIILPVELGLLVIFKSTYLTSKAWNILQKLKFW